MEAFPLVVVVGVIVPQAGEHDVVVCRSVHDTPWLLESLLTVAVKGVALNCGAPSTGMIAVVGVTEIVMAGTVMSTEPCLFGSETEVATIVTTRSDAGGVVGAE